jgi:hypothetical protein
LVITPPRSQTATKPREFRSKCLRICVSGFALLGACAAPPAERPLLREALHVLATQPLGRERVDWEALQRELEAEIPADGGLVEERAAIHLAVARLGDAHARYLEPVPPAAVAPVVEPPAAEARDAAETAVTLPPIPIVPEGRVLTGGVAYLLLPGCAAYDREAQLAYARVARRELARLAEAQPRGWILDLRLNGGGNIWPMLLGLQPLLGDGEHAGSIGPDGVHRLGCSANLAWLMPPDGAQLVQLEDATLRPAALPRDVRVAVLLGNWTMSSGELVALALRALPDARFFGEPTAGLTTATQDFPLSDGSRLNLPISWMCDARGWAPRGPIAPDVAVPAADWPSADDATAQRARDWIDN